MCKCYLNPIFPDPAPSIDGVYGKDWCMDLWREDKLPIQRKETLDLGATTSMGTQVSPISHQLFFFFFFVVNVCHTFRQAGNLLETEPELIFIKEEAYDDHPISQQISLPDNRKSASDSKI